MHCHISYSISVTPSPALSVRLQGLSAACLRSLLPSVSKHSFVVWTRSCLELPSRLQAVLLLHDNPRSRSRSPKYLVPRWCWRFCLDTAFFSQDMAPPLSNNPVKATDEFFIITSSSQGLWSSDNVRCFPGGLTMVANLRKG